MNRAFVSFNEEDLEICIELLEQDSSQYEGIDDDWEKQRKRILDSIIQRMKNVKKATYGD